MLGRMGEWLGLDKRAGGPCSQHRETLKVSLWRVRDSWDWAQCGLEALALKERSCKSGQTQGLCLSWSRRLRTCQQQSLARATLRMASQLELQEGLGEVSGSGAGQGRAEQGSQTAGRVQRLLQ